MNEAILSARDRMREEQRKKNREQAPNLAALVDELKEQFPGAKVVWGKDLVTGVEVGEREDDPERTFTIPQNYFPGRVVDVKKERKDGQQNRTKAR
jgi:hypothetical protein